MRETATLSNGTPSLSSPTAVWSDWRPPPSITSTSTVVIYSYAEPRDDLDLDLDDMRDVEPRSNADGGCSHGFPSYTTQRWAPPSWPREPAQAPRSAMAPSTKRSGREALKRRKRSRDFVRTGRLRR